MTYTLKGKCSGCGCTTTVEDCETDNRGFLTCPICGEQVVCNAMIVGIFVEES